MESVTTVPPTRREKQRASTIAEIKAVARELLVQTGPSGISLRAIARQMGISAPGLYRYFPSLEALITELCADLYSELREHMESECDKLPAENVIQRLLVAARAFRSWAVSHRPEFTLMFASLAPGSVIAGPGCVGASLDPEVEPYASMLRFSRVFGRMFNQVFTQSDEERGFSIVMPEPPPMSQALQEELIRCAVAIGMDVPLGFAFMFHSFWVRLYGLVAMEVFGQLPVVEQAEALFEAELFAMAGQLGVRLG